MIEYLVLDFNRETVRLSKNMIGAKSIVSLARIYQSSPKRKQKARELISRVIKESFFVY